ncbi:MAG: FAD-dependent oxidoreductase [Desulfohalobiaceae bacterium]|nr:FAD-dependent oxidoreductase [Desulfohalobiaceae bacterium]
MENRTSPFAVRKEGFDLSRAITEANRCLLCFDPPCSKGCPAGTNPGQFIRKLRLRNITGAIRTIKESNIFGGACGALCPTEELCEKECAATGIDRPIEIGRIQQALIEHGQKTGFTPLKPADSPKEKKVAVLGSGPAGLTCAAELAKEGYPVTVFEARPEPGGVLRYGLMPYRMDPDLLQGEIKDIESLGVEIRCSSPVKGEKAAEALLEKGYDALFLAPGLWSAKGFNEDGPPFKGRYSSVEYLAMIREERFAELESDFKGRRVAVIGGGDVAMECVQSASRLEAADVFLIYRRSFAQMPGEEHERIMALQSGVHFILLNQPSAYITDTSNRITGLKLNRTELGPEDLSGRRSPRPVQGSEWVLEIDTVIEAIGNQAEPGSAAWYPSVKTDQQSLIQADQNSAQTSARGIFAGGDIVRGPALVVTAVEDGKKAARSIMEHLTSQL